MCARPPVGRLFDVTALSNCTGATLVLERAVERFEKLFRRKAGVHHYTSIEGFVGFDDAHRRVKEVVASYKGIY